MKKTVNSRVNLISMLLIFILWAVVPKMIEADIPLGDQHCGDPKCLGKSCKKSNNS